MATGSREDTNFKDAPGVSGEGGEGGRKVTGLGPCTLGVAAPCACTLDGVGGKRASVLALFSGAGVKCDGVMENALIHLRRAVSLCDSISKRSRRAMSNGY